MSAEDHLHGLTCPNCGGTLVIPEGQLIVHCPYCDLRSFVRGERGLQRYQVLPKTDRESVLAVLKRFLSSNWAIARDAARNAQLTEAFLVYLPFWTVWARLAAWAFGQKAVGSGDKRRYEPREVRIVQDVTWNGAACDVGEFGVEQIPLDGQEMEPFNPDALHASGMVFEPVNSFTQARKEAEETFEAEIRSRSHLDRISQLFLRTFRRRDGLIYYPLWVLRYLYRGRAFQVVVDGYSGKVLYGKAPGNTIYRAAVLVASMAVGALLAVDAPAFLLWASDGDSEGLISFAFILLLIGLALMYVGYRRFRYGEQYEYRSTPPRNGSAAGISLDSLKNLSSLNTRDLEEWIDQLN
ncbi:MAG: hypothetical protein GX495_09070 [Chloroflexi bacterium]|jgi:DNA-directed RNA polymerase subunit RPC12/RpoP|nr:hypothetical protein [Chloroflexota bacterium]